ncbi:MAG TPA: DUF2950 domain-containing protein [Geobacteraceae bacterium]
MMVMTYRKTHKFLLLLLALLVIAASGVPTLAASPRKAQKSFASPEDAVKGLVAAVRSKNVKEAAAILGPGSRAIISSGDPVADRSGRELFLKLYDEKNAISGAESGKAVLSIGNEDYPFPIPVVKKGGAWRFDSIAGKEELLNRRIGRNELEVIDVLRAYVDAQRDYAAMERDGNGFAQKIRSTPGKKDGLYWEAKEGEEESPFGPMAAKAAREGYARPKSGNPSPFHGYLFRILKAQGKNAEGGAFDYVVNGKMILGFAAIAWPAQYGASGIMTFIVNQNGIVYQKDLGKNTGKTAAAMKLYDPDRSWKKVE